MNTSSPSSSSPPTNNDPGFVSTAVAQTAPNTEHLEQIGQIVESCGLEFDPQLGRESLLETAHLANQPLSRLTSALRPLGVGVDIVPWSLRQALSQLPRSEDDGGIVLFAAPSTGVSSGLTLVARQGRKVLLANGEWLDERELSQRLGLRNHEEAIDWGLARPLTPCVGMTAHSPDAHASHGGHAHHGPSPLKRLIGLLRAESKDLWVVSIFAIGVGILSLAVPITVEALVSSVQGGNQAMIQAVIVLTIILLCCLGLAGAMRALQTYIVELIQRRIFVRVVADLAYRLPRVQVSAFDGQHGPELVNRFFDVLTVQKASATLLMDGLAVLLQALVGMCVLAIWHPALLGFNVILLMSLCAIIWVLGRGAITAKIRESYAKYGVAGWLEEMVRHPLAFKSTGGQDYALQRADELTREYLLSRRESFRILYRQIIFGIGLQVVASAVLLGLGGTLVIRNELTIGQLVAAELIVAVIVGSFVKLGKSLESYYDLLAAVDKLGHLVDLPLEREQGEYDQGNARRGPARVELRQVSFEYHTDLGHVRVLDNVTAMIEPGERVAVIGPAGAGKSTLLELLYGLREPTSGRIELDGVDLREIRLESLREQVVEVSGAEAFDGTILENIRLGQPGITLSAVRDALYAVGLLDTVLAMPRGLHTPLATGGAPLSRGQVQRLMLARAIAGRPRLLLLDNTLDQLDPEVRRQILPVLFDPRASWTVVVVTHDEEVLAACTRRLELRCSGPSEHNHH